MDTGTVLSMERGWMVFWRGSSTPGLKKKFKTPKKPKIKQTKQKNLQNKTNPQKLPKQTDK